MDTISWKCRGCKHFSSVTKALGDERCFCMYDPCEPRALHLMHDCPIDAEPAPDPVHHPNHYSWRGGMECIDIAKELTKGSAGIEAYLIGCAVKYIYRYPKKNGLQDLDKAIECLNLLRKVEEEQ